MCRPLCAQSVHRNADERVAIGSMMLPKTIRTLRLGPNEDGDHVSERIVGSFAGWASTNELLREQRVTNNIWLLYRERSSCHIQRLGKYA